MVDRNKGLEQVVGGTSGWRNKWLEQVVGTSCLRNKWFEEKIVAKTEVVVRQLSESCQGGVVPE